jgi:hypothetical protein
LGIGYRHRLNDIWGVGVNLSHGNWVPELTLGADFSSSSDTNRHFQNALLASLGVNYFFVSRDRARLGIGLFGTTCISAGKTTLGVELPLTVEYFMTPNLSISASTGFAFSGDSARTHFMLGPKSILGSLGITWYFK